VSRSKSNPRRESHTAGTGVLETSLRVCSGVPIRIAHATIRPRALSALLTWIAMRQRYGYVACIVLPCIACSSSDGDPGPSNDVLPPPMPTTSTPIIIPGGNGGGSQNEGPRDGGTQPLTPEQVTALETSSCAGWKTEVESLPALLQLVVDVSGSMNEEAPGPGDESKWELTREALRDALDGLPDTTGVGVLYYPNRDTSRSSRPREITACVRTNELIPMALLGAPGSSHRD